MFCIYRPRTSINCTISLPASKSISNRLQVMNFLSGNQSKIDNLSDAGDTLLMQRLLHLVKNNQSNLCDPIELDTANAGTVMRFLTALLAVTPGRWLLTGSERMQQRPVQPLADALISLGTEISYTKENGFPPLLIVGNASLLGGVVKLSAGISSQFISALMMIGPLLKGGLEIELLDEIVSAAYIRMTQELMQQAGANVSTSENVIQITEGSYHKGTGIFTVEPDWSAAAFWYEMAAFDPQAAILLKGLSEKSVQGDSVLPLIFENFGVKSVFIPDGLLLSGSGNPAVSSFSYDFTDCPDLVQAVAVTCAALGIETELNGLKSLRLKETDRIEALKSELTGLGYFISTEGDQIHFWGNSGFGKNKGFPVIKHYDDHRMAMSFAPLALLFGKIYLDDPAVVQKSYPRFWEDLANAGFRLENKAF